MGSVNLPGCGYVGNDKSNVGTWENKILKLSILLTIAFITNPDTVYKYSTMNYLPWRITSVNFSLFYTSECFFVASIE